MNLKEVLLMYKLKVYKNKMFTVIMQVTSNAGTQRPTVVLAVTNDFTKGYCNTNQYVGLNILIYIYCCSLG